MAIVCNAQLLNHPTVSAPKKFSGDQRTISEGNMTFKTLFTSNYDEIVGGVAEVAAMIRMLGFR